jgi:hypothetical protein
MIEPVENRLIIARGSGIARFRVRGGRAFLRRALVLELLDQILHGVRDADRKLAGFQQRFERLDGRGIAAASQRENTREADVEAEDSFR